jgi:hypothetical protein
LEASPKLFDQACQQAQVATTQYAQIIDHPSDLETLYSLNVGTLMGFDLIRQWMQKIVNFNEGKPYTEHVPFERLFPGKKRPVCEWIKDVRRLKSLSPVSDAVIAGYEHTFRLKQSRDSGPTGVRPNRQQ